MGNDIRETARLSPTLCCLATAVLVYSLSLFLGHLGGVGTSATAFGIRVGEHTVPFGVSDFRYYYSALSLVSEASNPYEQNSLNLRAHQLGFETGVLSVYPPWTYVVLLPLSFLPPEVAALHWFAFNITLLYCLSQVIWQLILGPSGLKIASGAKFYLETIVNHLLPFLFILVILPPVWLTLYMGQLSIFVTCMLALALSAIVHNAPIRSGIFLALAMVKPTTPILFAVGTFCWAISHRKPYHFIGFALTLLLLTFASEVFCPGIVGSWMQARPDILNYAISTKHAVFGDAMQQIIYDYSDLWLGFPVYLAFILGLCLTIGGWIVFGKQNSLAYWFPLICISAAFAPSAFFMDHSITAIPLLGMLALACRPEISERTRDIIIAMLVGYFFLALGLMWLLNNYVYWFLIPLLLLPLTLVPLALVQPKSP